MYTLRAVPRLLPDEGAVPSARRRDDGGIPVREIADMMRFKHQPNANNLGLGRTTEA